MIAIAAINGFVAIVVAYLAYRQEVTRRELKRFNGSVDYQLQAIHKNLIDNPGPPTHPPMREYREGGDSAKD